MNDLTTFLLQPEWQRIGITLLHFLWQGAAILLGAWAIARVLKVPNGAGRYGLYLAAFAVMSVAPIITYKMANPVIEGTPNPAAAVRVDATTVAPESNRGTATDVAPESATTSPRLGSASVEDSAATELFGARSEILWAVTWLPRVVAFWVIGVTLLGVWFLLGLLGVWRLRRSGKRTDG